MARRAIFLDRDGTLNRDIGYAYRVDDLELLANVEAGLRRMAALGFELFVTTNQSGVAPRLLHARQHARLSSCAVERLRRGGDTTCRDLLLSLPSDRGDRGVSLRFAAPQAAPGHDFESGRTVQPRPGGELRDRRQTG